jgi:hypothetical protein
VYDNHHNTCSSGSERASAQEWWTRSDSWIERQLSQHFAAAGLPHFVLKHCRRSSLVTSSSCSSSLPKKQGRTEPAGGQREAAGPGDVTKVRVGGSTPEDGNQRQENSSNSDNGAQRRRVPRALESEEEGAEKWRSKLEALRNQQLALKARMASLR